MTATKTFIWPTIWYEFDTPDLIHVSAVLTLFTFQNLNKSINRTDNGLIILGLTFELIYSIGWYVVYLFPLNCAFYIKYFMYGILWYVLIYWNTMDVRSFTWLTFCFICDLFWRLMIFYTNQYTFVDFVSYQVSLGLRLHFLT